MLYGCKVDGLTMGWSTLCTLDAICQGNYHLWEGNASTDSSSIRRVQTSIKLSLLLMLMAMAGLLHWVDEASNTCLGKTLRLHAGMT